MGLTYLQVEVAGPSTPDDLEPAEFLVDSGAVHSVGHGRRARPAWGPAPCPWCSDLLSAGDHCMIVDKRGRRYLIQLEESALFSTHLGNVAHDDIIGREDGLRVTTSRGHVVLALRPAMADYTRLMPRIATVVYPKDLGAILILGDIYPGLSVLEAGSGSGAVTLALARAVGKDGRVVSYDVRPDMIERARENVAAALPDHPQLTFKHGDVSEKIDERGLDRVVLDLPEPWDVVPRAGDALAPGGILVSFVPTALQFQDLTTALRADRRFDLIETVEVLVRPWTSGRRIVRPAQRMVAHTGFITTARKCEPARPKED